MNTHLYDVTVTWTGNRGEGTKSYRGYDRDHEITAEGREPIAGSSDPSFRGDPTRWNPEQLQVVALSQCHMLWYLHLAATAGVIVLDYTDDARGVMALNLDGGGQFVQVVLRPTVTVSANSDIETARRLHLEVPAKCFITRSVNFPVLHEPQILRASAKP
ncbi:peroxiredoxin [Microbacterium sp. SZ1]|uniref:OsmC family protein n=1 Tax=Microbacterium sp. SZ1 TaxID=1849736 RepID=UPI000BBCCB49|nr:OsmC family protein [Microbacterium sp. SZ1]PCE16510.1 peroxiredoxin [Microbacterium sp. SZ1]